MSHKQQKVITTGRITLLTINSTGWVNVIIKNQADRNQARSRQSRNQRESAAVYRGAEETGRVTGRETSPKRTAGSTGWSSKHSGRKCLQSQEKEVCAIDWWLGRDSRVWLTWRAVYHQHKTWFCNAAFPFICCWYSMKLAPFTIKLSLGALLRQKSRAWAAR